MEDRCRNMLITVGIALALPIAITLGVSLFIGTANPIVSFYSVIVLGALAVFFGAKCGVPGCNSGFFWGGLLTIICHYWNHWALLDVQAQFAAVFSTVIILAFVASGRKKSIRKTTKARSTAKTRTTTKRKRR